MATYKHYHDIIINDDIELLREQAQRDMFGGADSPTKIRFSSISGTIDQFTEEVTFHTSDTWINVSGILGQVTEKDLLYGVDGRIKIGDTVITYHYSAISGVYHNRRIREIEILVPALSGIYGVVEQRVGSLAGYPICLQVYLNLDRNG